MKTKLKNFALASLVSAFAFVSVPSSAWEFNWNDDVKASMAEKHQIELRAARLEGKLEATTARHEADAAKAEAKLIKTSQAASRAEAARKGWHKRSVRAEKRAKKAELQLAKFKKADKKARRSA